jgi:hypothetical protein
MTQPGVGYAVTRGEAISKQSHYHLKEYIFIPFPSPVPSRSPEAIRGILVVAIPLD